MSEYKNRFWIGIDIGKSGAICIMENDQITLAKMPMIKDQVDYNKLYHELLMKYEAGNGMIIFEKLGVIFGSSKQTAFSMGYQSGAVEMACIGLSIPYAKIPAKEWQKRMFTGVDEITKTGTTKRDTKAMALVAAKRLYPNVKLTIGDRATKAHDGAVDALLMAGYAKIMYP